MKIAEISSLKSYTVTPRKIFELIRQWKLDKPHLTILGVVSAQLEIGGSVVSEDNQTQVLTGILISFFNRKEQVGTLLLLDPEAKTRLALLRVRNGRFQDTQGRVGFVYSTKETSISNQNEEDQSGRNDVEAEEKGFVDQDGGEESAAEAFVFINFEDEFDEEIFRQRIDNLEQNLKGEEGESVENAPAGPPSRPKLKAKIKKSKFQKPFYFKKTERLVWNSEQNCLDFTRSDPRILSKLVRMDTRADDTHEGNDALENGDQSLQRQIMIMNGIIQQKKAIKVNNLDFFEFRLILKFWLFLIFRTRKTRSS